MLCEGNRSVDRLTSMTVFVHVASARSFSVAARELGISQATASKHVQTLESWLGARLLTRTTRRVGLTDAGASFFAQCTRILDDMEAARLTGQTAATLRGHLFITAPVGFGSTLLARLVLEFMMEHPDLLLQVDINDRFVDVLEEGYDLAIRIGDRPPDDPGVVLFALRPLRFVLCAAPSYLEAHGTPEKPTDLLQMVCLTDTRHPGDVWRFTGPHGEFEVAVRSRLKSDNALLRREVARGGGGVLLAPEFVVEDDIAAGRLVRLLPNYTPLTLRIDAICPAHRAASPKVRGFVAFLQDRLAEQAKGGVPGTAHSGATDTNPCNE